MAALCCRLWWPAGPRRVLGCPWSPKQLRSGAVVPIGRLNGPRTSAWVHSSMLAGARRHVLEPVRTNPGAEDAILVDQHNLRCQSCQCTSKPVSILLTLSWWVGVFGPRWRPALCSHFSQLTPAVPICNRSLQLLTLTPGTMVNRQAVPSRDSILNFLVLLASPLCQGQGGQIHPVLPCRDLSLLCWNLSLPSPACKTTR